MNTLNNKPQENIDDEKSDYYFLDITEEERIEIDKFFEELDSKQSTDDRI